MPNIRYPHIANKALVERLLLKEGLTIGEAAEKCKVSYGAMLNQARRLLDKDAFSGIVRTRATYTRKEKLAIVKRCKEVGSVTQVAREMSIHASQIFVWRKEFRALKRERQAKLAKLAAAQASS